MYYQKLAIWQRSFELSVAMYQYAEQIKDYGFRNQITRSALSVPSNISEGMERQSEQEKHRFLSIAKASLGEFKTQLMIGERSGLLNREFAKAKIKEAEEIARMIAAMMRTLSK
ncbi:four helix bundle protein [Thalassotalea mangrovi]|uniref:Four helix bundle protein n=1 Tax=Thalassotalea mangrovi TaxID=2572245 RepID=A0A4U1B6K8_9GAMM|nr:four helix bundle protein [Thalassotalea mangrovi]TKB46155.1 four helix bundle protein [Thalassotalea mangrovi]